MKEQNIDRKMDHNLIEYILTLLSIPESNRKHAAKETSDRNCDRIFDGTLHNGTFHNETFHNETFHEYAFSQNSQDSRIAYGLIQFMDEMPGGFLIYRANGNEDIIYANQALLRLFQCDTLQEFRELTGNSFKGIVHPHDLDAVEKSIKEQISSNQYDLDYVEYRIIQKNGDIRWVEDYGHFIHGDITGDIFYVFIGDATVKRQRQQAQLQEQMQKEKELKEIIHVYDKERNVIHQEHLRRMKVIEGLSINYDSILYVDLTIDKIIPYRLSERTIRQFGSLSHTRVFSWYITDYINTWVHPEDRKIVAEATSLEYIHKELSIHKTYYINYRVLYLSEIQYLQLRIVNVGSENPISQIVMGYRRMDEEMRREMEQKQLLEEALHNANLAITAKNTFLSNMSHDMRTPLNAIFGFINLANSCITDNDTLRYYMNKIRMSSEQLLDLIDKVLEITWSEADNTQITENKCNLYEILQNVQNVLHPQAAEKNITISIDSSALTHQDIYSDSDKLEQLLLRLSNNAVKYTPKGGRVMINIMELESLPNDYATYQFVVEDNGIGISQEFINRMYEPFAREKNTTFSGVLGTGLGLTIVKNIVDMLGGSIEATSTVGKGSKFTVTLRLRTQTPSIPLNVNTETIIEELTNHKILLVEDNEVNLEIETAILQGIGFQIDTATDGSIAVEMMEHSQPGDYALILMDIQMPIMNGRQATRAIRNLKNKELSRIPIIALSADAYESDKRKSIESGMDAHLPKPIDVPLLLETIAKTLQTHNFLYGNKKQK